MAAASRRALLVCDVQVGVTKMAFGTDEALTDAYIGCCNVAIATARSNGDNVIFIRVGFQPGYTEVGPRNPSFAQHNASKVLVIGEEPTALHPKLDALESDPVLTKNRVGMFFNTSLQSILTSHDIDTLVIGGISTSAVVLTTVCQAFEFDYRLIVLSDMCFDSKQEVHDTLLKEVIPRRAVVMTVQEFTELV